MVCQFVESDPRKMGFWSYVKPRKANHRKINSKKAMLEYILDIFLYDPILINIQPDEKNIDWVFPDGYSDGFLRFHWPVRTQCIEVAKWLPSVALSKASCGAKSTPRRSEAEQKRIQTKPKHADLVACLSVYSCGETTNPMSCHFVVALLCTLQDLSE